VVYSRDSGDRSTLAWLIPIVARVGLETGIVDAVPVLLAISESNVVAPLWGEVDECAHLPTAAAARLGVPAYESRAAHGRSMTYDDAVTFMLETLDHASSTLKG
jgi:hypothetical protein